MGEGRPECPGNPWDPFKSKFWFIWGEPKQAPPLEAESGYGTRSGQIQGTAFGDFSVCFCPASWKGCPAACPSLRGCGTNSHSVAASPERHGLSASAGGPSSDQCHEMLRKSQVEVWQLSALGREQRCWQRTMRSAWVQLSGSVQKLKHDLGELRSVSLMLLRDLQVRAQDWVSEVATAACDPLLCSETLQGKGTGPETPETILVECSHPGRPVLNKTFTYERVYGPAEGQDAVFQDVRPLLTSFLDGYNVCIMAYGQTGGGKSYTMLGPQSKDEVALPSEARKDLGVVPRAAEELFRLISENPSQGPEVQVSIVEVYNNEIFDLLAKDHSPVAPGTKREGKRELTLARQELVGSASEFMRLVDGSLQLRVRHPTLVHADSSRSHLIIAVTLPTATSLDSSRPRLREKQQAPHPASAPRVGSGDSPAHLQQVPAYLQLVDLAGSECIGVSGVTGQAMREAAYINRSLAALEDVLGALRERRGHVPYRNSKLTHLLQDSIGGDAKLLVVLCVSPCREQLAPTLQTLGFGARARQVQRGPQGARVRPRYLSCWRLPSLNWEHLESSWFHSGLHSQDRGQEVTTSLWTQLSVSLSKGIFLFNSCHQPRAPFPADLKGGSISPGRPTTGQADCCWPLGLVFQWLPSLPQASPSFLEGLQDFTKSRSSPCLRSDPPLPLGVVRTGPALTSPFSQEEELLEPRPAGSVPLLVPHVARWPQEGQEEPQPGLVLQMALDATVGPTV
ncbi:PREDICTED: uncharacterized protein LOC102842033 [Chrysochloris asiatica]|uniref:Uncharacterized protein LOC102842033 n=1 Tax=Chrysochloris asiatica TaxID=185453 RepID=A0A9B0TWA4_CHRAS|nr:PREDICTED: uncharacterized protein LOC102842033 [Chrysochloris asiatica]